MRGARQPLLLGVADVRPVESAEHIVDEVVRELRGVVDRDVQPALPHRALSHRPPASPPKPLSRYFAAIAARAAATCSAGAVRAVTTMTARPSATTAAPTYSGAV